MTEVLYKIKDLFMKLFEKKYLQLPAATYIEETIKVDNINRNAFKENLRILKNEDEKELIYKFESGEMNLKEMTGEIFKKINSRYFLEINRNIEKIQANLEKVKKLKFEVE